MITPTSDPIATELLELLEALEASDRKYDQQRRYLIAAFAIITAATAAALVLGITL